MILSFTRALSGALLPLATCAALSGPIALAISSPAFACGDESGLSCDTDEDDARYMLNAAVSAVEKDEPHALA